MRQDVHCAELVIDNAIGAASFVLRHFMTSLFFYLRQKSDVRLAGRVSPRNTLLEQLSFPFFQKAVDFYDERMVSAGRTRRQLAEFAPAFLFFADHLDHFQLSGELNGPL
jgi:hypothetical protein